VGDSGESVGEGNLGEKRIESKGSKRGKGRDRKPIDQNLGEGDFGGTQVLEGLGSNCEWESTKSEKERVRSGGSKLRKGRFKKKERKER